MTWALMGSGYAEDTGRRDARLDVPRPQRSAPSPILGVSRSYQGLPGNGPCPVVRQRGRRRQALESYYFTVLKRKLRRKWLGRGPWGAQGLGEREGKPLSSRSPPPGPTPSPPALNPAPPNTQHTSV